MRKVLLLCALLLAVGAAWSDNIDLVVMVDTSESMFRVFPDVVDYLLADLLTNHLRFGDTFHLLTFADTPDVEIAGAVDSKAEIEQILRRLLLLKPLGRYTDLVAALRYLSGYVRELPERNRKTILLLTDGIHDPPPDSPFRMDPEKVRQALFQTAQEIARAGWKVEILRLPSGDAAATATAGALGGTSAGTGGGTSAGTGGGTSAGTGGGTSAGTGAGTGGGTATGIDYIGDIASVLHAPVADLEASRGEDLSGAVGFPAIRFPAGVIRGGKRLTVTFVVESSSPAALYLDMDGVLLDGKNILQESASVIVPAHNRRELPVTIVVPDGTAPGRHVFPVELTFAAGMRASPSHGDLVIDYTGRPGMGAGVFGRARSGGASLLFVLLGVAGVVMLLLVAIGLRTRVDFGSLAHNRGYRESRFARERTGGHPLVEMIVTMQNRHIGHRNVHALSPGATRWVGGGRSAYLVYFVRVPPAIAYLTYDGRTYTFVSARAELFPGVSGQIADCLGREIPAVSPRGYPFTIVFRPYRSPLDEVNSLLRSIRLGAETGPGQPSGSAGT